MAGQQQNRIRFDVLDDTLATIGQLHPSYATGSLSLRAASRSARSIQGLEVPAGEAADLSPADLLSPWWIDEAGTATQLGVFIQADHGLTVASAAAGVADLELDDQALLLDVTMPSTVGYPRGTPPADALAGLLSLAGVDASIDATPAPALVEPVSWSRGEDNLWRAIEGVCDTGGWWPPLWPVDGGPPRAEALPDPSALSDGVDLDGAGVLVAGSVRRQVDVTAYNRFVAVAGADDAPFVGVYDLPAEAPNSAARVGRTIVAPNLKVTATSQAEVDRAARTAALRVDRQAEEVSFDQLPDPTVPVREVVRVDGDLWLMMEATLPLGVGVMRRRGVRLWGVEA